jgi:hypothetical protein
MDVWICPDCGAAKAEFQLMQAEPGGVAVILRGL